MSTQITIPLSDLISLLKLDEALFSGVSTSPGILASIGQLNDPSIYMDEENKLWLTKHFKTFGQNQLKEKALHNELRRKRNVLIDTISELTSAVNKQFPSLKADLCKQIAEQLIQSKAKTKIAILIGDSMIKPEWQEVLGE